jgi:hypothetical protein
MTFKEQYQDFQRIALEIKRLRDHNVSFPGDSSDLFFFAEGTMVLLGIERFLRMILGADARQEHTLHNLLEMVTSSKRNLIVLPGGLQRDAMIRAIVKVRNVIMHGNYEQAAKESGLASKDDYFRSSRYIKDVELLYRLLNRMAAQIDPDTGRRWLEPKLSAYLSSRDFLDLSHAGHGEEHTPSRLVAGATTAPPKPTADAAG